MVQFVKSFTRELLESLSESFGRFQKDPMQSYVICFPKMVKILLLNLTNFLLNYLIEQSKK